MYMHGNTASKSEPTRSRTRTSLLTLLSFYLASLPYGIVLPNSQSNDPRRTRKSQPRVVSFAGKAAPDYYIAKLTMRLIVNVARAVNSDPDTKEYLGMFFLPDYSVSLAEVLMLASDLSQHSKFRRSICGGRWRNADDLNS